MQAGQAGRHRALERREAFTQPHHGLAQQAGRGFFAGVERGQRVRGHVQAAAGTLVCALVALQQRRVRDVLALLVRLALGPAQRARLDRQAVQAWQRLDAAARRLWQQLRYGRSSRRQAQQMFDELRQRSREGAGAPPRPKVQREGNVYKPERFKGSAKSSDEN